MSEFCEAVARVVEEVPEPFHGWLENVVVDVETAPSREVLEEQGLESEDDLLGLFEGLAVTEQEYGEHAPNRIVIYKRPIERICRSRAEVEYEIRRTMLHELAHHFGHSEEDLEEFESRSSPFEPSDGRDEEAS